MEREREWGWSGVREINKTFKIELDYRSRLRGSEGQRKHTRNEEEVGRERKRE